MIAANFLVNPKRAEVTNCRPTANNADFFMTLTSNHGYCFFGNHDIHAPDLRATCGNMVKAVMGLMALSLRLIMQPS